MSAFPRVELDREPKGDFLGLPLRLREGFRILSSVQFSCSVASTLCDPTDGITPGFPKVVEGLKFGSCFLTSCVTFSRNTPPSGQVSYPAKRGLVKPLPRELSKNSSKRRRASKRARSYSLPQRDPELSSSDSRFAWKGIPDGKGMPENSEELPRPVPTCTPRGRRSPPALAPSSPKAGGSAGRGQEGRAGRAPG